MENARNIPYAQIGTIEGNPHGSLPDFTTPNTVTVSSTIYQIYYEVTYIDDPADGTALLGTDSAPNDVKDETHLIHFEGCRSATNGQYLSQRQYFTFDILQMEEAVEAPYPESDFNLLPETSQIQGLTDIPETQEEESHNQSPEDLSQDSPISNIPMYQTPDEEYSLPLQSDGSIDLDFLKLTWKTFYPATPTFHEWCMDRHIPNQIFKNNLVFKENLTFLSLKHQRPSTAFQHYNLWASTFSLHQKS